METALLTLAGAAALAAIWGLLVSWACLMETRAIGKSQIDLVDQCITWIKEHSGDLDRVIDHERANFQGNLLAFAKLHERLDTLSDLTCERQQALQSSMVVIGNNQQAVQQALAKLETRQSLYRNVPQTQAEKAASVAPRHIRHASMIVGQILNPPKPPVKETSNEAKPSVQA